jgi:predicted CxxxxCH...CXXCH cytochrome family protein
MNGALEVSATGCTSCHGTAGRASVAGADANQAAAPPLDTAGASTGARVGGHLAHVNRANLVQAPLACAVCHGALDASHPSGGAAKIQFAASAGASAAYAAGTCSNTSCHARGGSTPSPAWTGGAMACGSCHGAPPGGSHPANAACGGCHAGYTATTVNKAVHLNGTVDVSAMTCTSCHGKAGQTATAASPLAAAPPVDASGASTGIRVGAHQKHLTGGTYANALACKTCHASVATYTTGHADGTRQVAFTGAANANLAKGTWRAGTATTAGTCASTWCHGAVISQAGGTSGGTLTAPSWTATVTACTACHSVSLSSLPNRHSTHSSRATCADCHSGYSATAANKTLHVNGAKDVGGSGTQITSWNASTRTCSNSCHGSKSW